MGPMFRSRPRDQRTRAPRGDDLKQVVSWARCLRVLVAALLVATAMLGYGAGAATADSTWVPPPGSWNTKKVYFSPSSQTGNIGCGSYVESVGAQAIATKVKDYLYARGFAVRIGSECDEFEQLGLSRAHPDPLQRYGFRLHVPV